ncbi:CRISPR-associated protein Cas4 [Halanaerobacter jeridensis]|uniref:CRISPR-associated protein Cas4 n=1 Tax=Halanaerobacter jeridensis TaxID=706427 RepID=UPI003083FA3F
MIRLIKVTDIKQYAYCQRIIYFTYCMPVQPRQTYKMQNGQERHDRNEELEPRRTLERYGLEEGEKRFGVRLSSPELNLKGEMDMMVVQEGNYIPIELKYTNRQPGINHKYQLIAYCLLVEDQYQTKINRGLIHLIPPKETIEVELTPGLREEVKEIISGINEIIATEKMPAPTSDRGKCRDCEYQNYCGDV